MEVKDIIKMERTSLKRNFKEEVEETEKMNFDVYCILCQTYGHIFSEECVVRATCLNCGFKGHFRRNCKKRKRDFKNIKMEEIKREISNCENEYVEEEVPKDEPKNDALQLDSDSGITEIGKDIIKNGKNNPKACVVNAICFTCGIKGHARRDCKEKKCGFKNIKIEEIKGESSNSENEYLEEEMPKDEPKNDEKRIKFEVYCILCQIHGHILSEACIVNAICFVCGIKGHVRRDCKEEKWELKKVKSEVKKEVTKYEKEYVEVEIKKDETKTEEQLKPHSEITEVEEDMIRSLTTSDENNEKESSMNLTDIGENCEWKRKHSLKRCSVNLHKVTINQYEKASRKSNRQAKHDNISYASQKYSYQSERKANFTPSLKKCTVNLVSVIIKQNEEDSSESNRQAEHDDVSYTCEECNYETKFKGALRIHIQAKHEGVIYSCKKCSYEAKYKGSLAEHIKADHEGVIYSCKKCSYETKYKRNLTTHIQAEHEGVTHLCKECSFETKYKRALRAHIKGEHEGVTYLCKKCSFKAKYKGYLTTHIQAEHEGVLYSCKICSYGTKYKGHLRTHSQAEHEGVVYSCKKCSYESKYKSNLKKHMQAVH